MPNYKVGHFSFACQNNEVSVVRRITKFLTACRDNQVSAVRRMIREGVDINARNSIGYTGLYVAMMCNNIDIVRLLLAHSDIQIDCTYSGRTVLHVACHFNSVESVRLFLAHPACTKDIVTMGNSDGNTAEMMAKNEGNLDCARLFREYLEKADKPQEERSIDDILKDIEGTSENTSNKKKKNRKPNKRENYNDEGKNMRIKDEASKSISSAEWLKEKECTRLVNNNTEIAAEIKSKQLELQEIKSGLEKKAGNIKPLLVKMEEAETSNLVQQKKINLLNIKISDMKAIVEEAKREKNELEKKVEINNKHLAKLTEKKSRLDKYIESKIQERTKKAKSIEVEIVLLEEQAVKNNKKSEDLFNQVITEDPRKELLNFLIKQKEKDLECPVCLVTATVPIYSCLESHLICSACRPRVAECPECRVLYKDKKPTRRHRYAERMVEELNMLRGELSQSGKSL